MACRSVHTKLLLFLLKYCFSLTPPFHSLSNAFPSSASMKSFFCFTISDKVADCASEDSVGSMFSEAQSKLKHCGPFQKDKFSWEELNKLTKNFSKQIGSGGFSTVYLARLPDFGLAAVKIQSTCTERLARIHDQELQILTTLNHPNVVKFIGHCEDKEDERALVFEYACNGNLYDKLHGRVSLTWKSRVLIAFQLALALEYLHGMQIIHGDIKSLNILLDQQLNCKLCDFGSAKQGFTFTSMVLTKMDRMIMGSQGYMDPHYLKTGLVSKKNDVYSYGVVLLELITGREAFSMTRGDKLTDVLSGVVGLEGIIDPRLKQSSGFDLENVKTMVSLAKKCIGCSPMVRPCASEIVASFKDKFQSITHL